MMGVFRRVAVMKNKRVVSIDRVIDDERYIPVPRRVRGKIVSRLKPLRKRKGNCYFTTGVARNTMDFIYRAVVQLKIDGGLIVSRGSIRDGGRPLHHAVELLTLDWGLGTSLVIPATLKQDHIVTIMHNDQAVPLKAMELIILPALLHIAWPGISRDRCRQLAEEILISGWKAIDFEKGNASLSS